MQININTYMCIYICYICCMLYIYRIKRWFEELISVMKKIKVSNIIEIDWGKGQF